MTFCDLWWRKRVGLHLTFDPQLGSKPIYDLIAEITSLEIGLWRSRHPLRTESSLPPPMIQSHRSQPTPAANIEGSILLRQQLYKSEVWLGFAGHECLASSSVLVHVMHLGGRWDALTDPRSERWLDSEISWTEAAIATSLVICSNSWMLDLGCMVTPLD